MKFILRTTRPKGWIGKKNPVEVVLCYSGSFVSKRCQESEVQGAIKELKEIASEVAGCSTEEEFEI